MRINRTTLSKLNPIQSNPAIDSFCSFSLFFSTCALGKSQRNFGTCGNLQGAEHQI